MGHACLGFGWTPPEFWQSTPHEFWALYEARLEINEARDGGR